MSEEKPWLDMPIIRPLVPADLPKSPAPTWAQTLGGAAETITSPEAQAADQAPAQAAPSLEEIRSRIQEADRSAQDYLKPSADAGPLEWGVKAAGSLGVHLATNLAQFPLNILMGVTRESPQGYLPGPPGQPQPKFETPGATIDPGTGRLGVTPEAATAGSIAAFPLRFGRANTLMRDTPGALPTLTKPPPVTVDELRAAIVRAGEKPEPSAAGQPGIREPGFRQDVDPTKPFTYNPPSSGWPAGTERWAEREGGQPAAPVPTAPSARAPISKSGDAFKVSDAFYETFDQAAKDGGSLTPNVANKVVDKVESYLPPPGMAEAFGAGDELKGIVAKLQQYRDKPMSLLDVKAVDQQIGDLIHQERDPIKGMSPYGRQLQEIQDDLRDITEKPAASDVVGGQAGLDALAPARQAYSQAKKMQELERLWERAQQTDNPTTSYRTQVKNLFDNRRRSAGFTDEEKAIVKDAAARGVVGGGVHLLGSRLIPIAAGAAEPGTHGLTAGTAAAIATYYGGTGMRALENRLATKRFESAQTFLGQRVPHLPNQLGPFAPP